MKKILSLTMILLVIFSMFSVFTLQVRAESEDTENPPAGYIPTPTPTKEGSEKLLIQDGDPWGYTSNVDILEQLKIELGYDYAVKYSSWLNTATVADLEQYSVVITASDQYQIYFDRLINNKAKLAQFVYDGGILVVHGADRAWRGGVWGSWAGKDTFLPLGVDNIHTGEDDPAAANDLTVVVPDHCVVNGPYGMIDSTGIDNWGYSSHGYFRNVPAGADIIIVDGKGRPVYIHYEYGMGHVLAIMMTVEWRGRAPARETGPKLMKNELYYAQTLVVPIAQQMVKPTEGYIVSTSYRFNFDYLKEDPKIRGDMGYKGHRGIDVNKPGIMKQRKLYTTEDEWRVPVFSPADGEVVYVVDTYTPQPDPYTGMPGKWLWIWHGDILDLDGKVERSISTRYLHLDEILKWIVDSWKKGEKIEIRKGTLIGYVGDTGAERVGPHLHFEVWQGGSRDFIKNGEMGPIGKGTDIYDKEKKQYPYYSLTDKGKQLVALNPLRFVDYIEKPKRLEFSVTTERSVDLIVVDPDGLTISKEVNELPTVGWYAELGMIEDGDVSCDVIAIDDRKQGDYSVTVIPEPGALPTEKYTLEVSTNGIRIVLAENVKISEIPARPYIVRSTETEIIPIIPATVDFDPDTLNLKSKGQWVTVYIELPVGHGYDVSMIDLASIRLNGQIQAEVKPTEIGDYDGDGIPDLMVKFNRTAVQNILEVGEEVEITISGKLIDGRPFEGKDTIKVALPP